MAWAVLEDLLCDAEADSNGSLVARTNVTLDPDVLLVGFARRAATYKRSDLIFRDRARIEPLLTGRRLQLVFAGKNHPDDAEGRKRYRYSAPAFLEPHTFRLCPRQDGGQRVHRHTLDISPTPAGRTDGIDRDGNVMRFASPTRH